MTRLIGNNKDGFHVEIGDADMVMMMSISAYASIHGMTNDQAWETLKANAEIVYIDED